MVNYNFTGKEEPFEAGNKLINAPLELWLVVLGLWFFVGVIVFYTMGAAIIGYAILFIVWAYFNSAVINEQENAISVCWGKMNGLSSSGPVFILRGVEKLLRYPTSAQQIIFEKEAVIITKTGPSQYDKKEIIMKISLPVKIAINFTWSRVYEDLRRSVKFAPPPTKEGLKELANQLEELFLNVVGTVGGKYTWEEIAQQGTFFAQEMSDVVNGRRVLLGVGENEAQQLQKMIELFQLKNITVSLRHIDLPSNLVNAMEARAAAFSLGESSRIKELSERLGIAAGEAEIRRALATVINELGPNALKLEALLTLAKMAQEGNSTYMAFPQEVYGILTKALGGSSPEQAFGGQSEETIRRVFESVMRERGKQ